MIRFLTLLTTLVFLPVVSAEGQDAVVDVPLPARSILPSIVENIGEAAVGNLKNPEQIFCYEVSAIPPRFTGYTLHNMAITGFCGIIPKAAGEMMVGELLMNPETIRFGQKEKCEIRPRAVLRFFRGVDSTDIMLSSPCHSIAIFYGGRVRTYNFKPGAEVMDGLLGTFQKLRTEFISPAILGQLLPIGVITQDSDRKLIEQKSQPARNWSTGQGSKPASGVGTPSKPTESVAVSKTEVSAGEVPGAPAAEPVSVPKQSWGTNTGESSGGDGWNKLAQ